MEKIDNIQIHRGNFNKKNGKYKRELNGNIFFKKALREEEFILLV